MDGNRRWARAAGHLDPSVGHRVGAEHVEDVLRWCVTLAIGYDGRGDVLTAVRSVLAEHANEGR